MKRLPWLPAPAGALTKDRFGLVGRAVAALAADKKVMKKSGKVLVAAALAIEYGFTDVDGRQPRPLSVEET